VTGPPSSHLLRHLAAGVGHPAHFPASSARPRPLAWHLGSPTLPTDALGRAAHPTRRVERMASRMSQSCRSKTGLQSPGRGSHGKRRTRWHARSIDASRKSHAHWGSHAGFRVGPGCSFRSSDKIRQPRARRGPSVNFLAAKICHFVDGSVNFASLHWKAPGPAITKRWRQAWYAHC